MSGHFWLSDAQMGRLRSFFPKSRGRPRVDDRRVLSGIIYIQGNGLQWKDAPSIYGPPKTLYNRFVRWSRMGVFARIFAELAQPGPDGDARTRRRTVLTVGSGAAHSPLQGWSAYCASKAGAHMLTRALDLEARVDGIRAISLSPGTVATDMQDTIRRSGVNPVSHLIGRCIYLPNGQPGHSCGCAARMRMNL